MATGGQYLTTEKATVDTGVKVSPTHRQVMQDTIKGGVLLLYKCLIVSSEKNEKPSTDIISVTERWGQAIGW